MRRTLTTLLLFACACQTSSPAPTKAHPSAEPAPTEWTARLEPTPDSGPGESYSSGTIWAPDAGPRDAGRAKR